MTVTRVERKAKARAQRKNAARLSWALFAVVTLALVGLIVRARWVPSQVPAAATRSASSSASGPSASATSAGEALSSSVATGPESDEEFLTYAPIPSSTDATLVEVPDVVGRTVSEAASLLQAADLGVGGSSGVEDSTSRVLSQQPAAGNIVVAATKVTLAVEGASDGSRPASVLGKVVVIDPGHQSHADMAGEPIGPGSATLKARATGGATGVITRVPEYEVALEIAMNVRARLLKAGVKVVMTRMTNDVDVSNAERAREANSAGAALFVRIHADGNADGRAAGIQTLYPAVTQWTKATSAPSKRAAALVQTALITSTSAKNVGITARSDLAGFNWCTKPSILIECGFLSNSVEDRLLTSPGYQDKLAEGIASGILKYLGG